MPLEEPEDVAQRLAESSRWYQQFAAKRRCTHLERNIEKVVRRSLRRSSANDDSANPQNLGPEVRTGGQRTTAADNTSAIPQRGRLIQQIADKLAPFDLGVGDSEQVLLLDAKTLQRDLLTNGFANGHHNGATRCASKDTAKSFRCKCEVTVWYTSRTSSVAKGRKLQLLRDSQLCTIQPHPGSHPDLVAILRLEAPFKIRASKLIVPIRRGHEMKLQLGEDYFVQVSLQPLDFGIWPSLLTADSGLAAIVSSSLDAPEPLLHLTTRINVLPRCPPLGTMAALKLLSWSGQDKVETRLRLNVDASWTTDSRKAPAGNEIPKRPLTPVSELGDAESKTPLILYVFGSSSQFYRVRGCLCPFCQHRNFHTIEVLQIHLLKDHDCFKYQFEYETKDGGVPEIAVNLIDASIKYERLAGEPIRGGKADNWTWTKPRNATLALDEYLSGSSDWILGKKYVKPARVHRPVLADSSIRTSDRLRIRQRARSNKADDNMSTSVRSPVPPKPPMPPRKKFVVPAPPSEGSYFRTTTKRPLQQGEMLSESDEDVDESWLKQHHLDTIDELSGVAPITKEFMKRWDSFVLEESIPADKFVKGALLRFVDINQAWLRRGDMRIELFKFATKFVAWGIVDASVVRSCGELLLRGDVAEDTVSRTESEVLDPSEPRSAKLRSKRTNKASGSDLSHPEERDKDDMSLCPSCNKSWDISNAIACDGPKCPSRFYHRACAHVGRRIRGWRCEQCRSNET